MKTFNSFLTNSNDYNINEGGAYGHLSHIFEDHDLTFSDLYELIDLAVEGSLLEKNFTTEKIDGRNILITAKDGKLRIARSMGQVKNYGETTLTPEDAIEKFKGHIVEDIFSSAFKELSYYFELLDNNIKTEVFKNGKIFLNVEIQYKEKRVTIPYSSNALIFSGIREYDINGNVIDENSNEVPNKLANAINELNKPSNFIYRICSYLKIVLAAHSLSIIYVLLYFHNLLLFILISSQIYYEFKLFSFNFRNLIFKYLFLTYRFLFVINFFILKASFFIKNVWLLFFLFILDACY